METKESLENKRKERMRSFGIDLKNSGEDKADNMGGSMDDEIKAKRLARFGEVDPADLKRANNN